MLTTKQKPKVLFIHQGKECDLGANRVFLMPMGIVAMADYLCQNGIGARIINIPVERRVSPEFDIVSAVRDYGVSIICLDLHWHQQSHAVIEVMSNIKRELPEIITIIGGYTASFFHRELMERFPQIDYIIRGDAEIPLLSLIRCLLAHRISRDIAHIPNVVFRKKGAIHANKQSFCLSPLILRRLNFSNFNLLDNHPFYTKRNVFEGDIESPHINRDGVNSGVFFYNCGRGCPYTCSICGGSKHAQKIIAGRQKVVYTPIAAVVRNLKCLKDYSIDTWHNTFSPSKDMSYFLELFKELRKNKIDLHLRFECQHIPSEDFIVAAERTFKSVRLDFVIQTGSERLRKMNKGNFYPNRDLIALLAYLGRTSVSVDICLIAGIPFEQQKDIVTTLLFINFIKNNFRKVNICPTTFEIEPASPWYLDERRYGIQTSLKSFNDFLLHHAAKNDIGYRTQCLTTEQIYFIKEYYTAESRCSRKRSFFLEKLTDSHTKHDHNFFSVHSACQRCSQYTICFGAFRKG